MREFAAVLQFIIGDGENMMDFTYVVNVVHAHLCAEKALRKPATDPESDPSGKVRSRLHSQGLLKP